MEGKKKSDPDAIEKFRYLSNILAVFRKKNHKYLPYLNNHFQRTSVEEKILQPNKTDASNTCFYCGVVYGKKSFYLSIISYRKILQLINHKKAGWSYYKRKFLPLQKNTKFCSIVCPNCKVRNIFNSKVVQEKFTPGLSKCKKLVKSPQIHNASYSNANLSLLSPALSKNLANTEKRNHSKNSFRFTHPSSSLNTPNSMANTSKNMKSSVQKNPLLSFLSDM